MKRNLKKTLATVMAAALTVSLIGTSAEADAAKKIKLSKKSITVTKGKSKKVTIKNVKAKQVKKLTVKSSKNKIASVKKAGKTAIKVTGKKAGSVNVTVKVTVKGKKTTKLTLKVKVKNAAKVSVTPGVSQAPSSQAPASQAPSSQTPASQAPSSQAPASQAPASQAPSSQTPASQAPSSQAPASQAPASQAPVVTTLDFSDPATYTYDGEGVTAVCNNAGGPLKVTLPQFQAIIIKAPDDGNKYKYASVLYSSNSAIHTYLLDGAMTDGIGQTPDGQHQVDSLLPGEHGAIFKADAGYEGDCLKAIKFVHVDFDNAAAKELNLISIQFSTTEIRFETPDESQAPASQAPEASKAPEVSQAPETSQAPEESRAPEASQAPEASTAPEASQEPEESQAPATPAPIVTTVDFSNPAAYASDGSDVVAAYNNVDSSLSVTVPQFQGIILKAPDDGNVYKSAKITYTSGSAISAYLLDGAMTDGMGQTPPGQHGIGSLAAAAEESSVIYKVAENYEGGCLKGIKFVHVDFSNSAAKELKIKSVQFSTEENFTEGPGVETPEATKALY